MAAALALECPICVESLNTPKVLQCGHTFCLDCIDSYIKDKTGTFLCPICQQNITIPVGGAKMFTTCFILQTIPQVTDDKPKLSGKPTISDTPTSVQTSEIRTTLQHYCPNHSKKEVDYFCQTCSLGLCSRCIYRDHNDHKTLDLECDSTKEMVVQEISKSEKILKNKIQYLENTQATLLETSQKLKSFCNEACSKISERTEQIISELKQNSERRQREIKKHFHKNDSQVTETRQKVLTQIKNIKIDLNTFCPTKEEPLLNLIHSLTKLQDLQKLYENMKTDIPKVTYEEWKEGSTTVNDFLGSTITKPLHQSIEGNEPTSAVPYQVYQYGKGSISTSTKPLHPSTKGLFKFNYEDIKNDEWYYSEDNNFKQGLTWKCGAFRNSHKSCLGIEIGLHKYNSKGHSFTTTYTVTLLNKDKVKNVTYTNKETFRPGTMSWRNQIEIPLSRFTDPSGGFIDNEGQFHVQFDILALQNIQYE